jgi:hypothetical protein
MGMGHKEQIHLAGPRDHQEGWRLGEAVMHFQKSPSNKALNATVGRGRPPTPLNGKAFDRRRTLQ